ncbi:hypothetical protein J4212_02645 [Candidatus Woesearchaeota archaeon]|nr:hypothetical protein [Candidatus Woesearchaeota archaeon]
MGHMQQNRKLLENVSPDKAFVLSNGRVMKNVYELMNSLMGMDDSVFSHHVNYERNDFANWIRYVFEDVELADRIHAMNSKEDIYKALKEAMSQKQEEKAEGDMERNLMVLPSPFPKQQRRQNPVRLQIKKAIKKSFGQQKKEKKPAVLQRQLSEEGSIRTPGTTNEELLGKIDEILAREKEILAREKEIDYKESRIKEVEERVEEKLKSRKSESFFSPEFVQGIVTGFLVTLIAMLLYIKFSASFV